MHTKITCPSCHDQFTIDVAATPRRARSDGRPVQRRAAAPSRYAEPTPETLVDVLRWLSQQSRRPGASAPTKAWYEDYLAWAVTHDVQPLSTITFVRQLEDFGFTRWRTAKAKQLSWPTGWRLEKRFVDIQVRVNRQRAIAAGEIVAGGEE